MKKLLILMLVLGLASTASATLSALAPVVAGQITWDIQGPAGFEQLIGTNLAPAPRVGNPGYGVDYGNTAGPQIVWGIPVFPPVPPAVYPGSLGQQVNPAPPPATVPRAGTLAFVQDSAITGFSWWGFDLGEGVGIDGIGLAAGVWYIFDLTGAVPGMHVDLYDYGGLGGFNVPAGTLVVVPEPATIALLGLGGLLLRRRKQTA